MRTRNKIVAAARMPSSPESTETEGDPLPPAPRRLQIELDEEDSDFEKKPAAKPTATTGKRKARRTAKLPTKGNGTTKPKLPPKQTDKKESAYTKAPPPAQKVSASTDSMAVDSHSPPANLVLNLAKSPRRSWTSPPQNPGLRSCKPGELSKLGPVFTEVRMGFEKAFPEASPPMKPTLEFLALMDRNKTNPHHHIDLDSPQILSNKFMVSVPLFNLIPIIPSALVCSRLATAKYAAIKGKEGSIYSAIVPSNRRYHYWVTHVTNAGDRLDHDMKGLCMDVEKFLKNQFEQWGDKKEKDSLRCGLVERGQNIVIWFFDRDWTPYIIAFIQYHCHEVATYISWFSVDRTRLAGSPQVGRSSVGFPTYKGIGLGTFLLSLIQIQNSCHNRSPSLLLQSNRGSEAFKYYLKRGFRPVPNNELSSVPGLPDDAYSGSRMCYFTNERQATDGTDPNAWLVLLSLKGYVRDSYNNSSSTFFLHRTIVEALPSEKHRRLFPFPFDLMGSQISHLYEDTSRMIFFGCEALQGGTLRSKLKLQGPIVRQVVTRDEHGIGMREEGDLQRCHRATQVYYQDLPTDTSWFRNVHLDIWYHWMLRDPANLATRDVECLPTKIVDAVKNVWVAYGYHRPNEMLAHLQTIDEFLYGNPNVLSSRLIFFSCLEDHGQWFGFCAVNPWVALVREWQTCKTRSTEQPKNSLSCLATDNLLCGLIVHEAKQKENEGNHYGIYAGWCRWFLNYASKYRDLRLRNREKSFVVVELTKEGCTKQCPSLHFFLLGLEGPFGSILHKTEAYKKYPTYSVGDSKRIVNDTAYNAGVVWCLFVYDTILTFRNVPTEIPENHATVTSDRYGEKGVIELDWLGLGTLTNPETIDLTDAAGWKNNATVVCTIFRAEMRLLLERLRVLFLMSSLGNRNKNVALPTEYWGTYDESFQKYLEEQKVVTSHCMKKTRKTKIRPSRKVQQETTRRDQVMDKIQLPPLGAVEDLMDYVKYAKHYRDVMDNFEGDDTVEWAHLYASKPGIDSSNTDIIEDTGHLRLHFEDVPLKFRFPIVTYDLARDFGNWDQDCLELAVAMLLHLNQSGYKLLGPMTPPTSVEDALAVPLGADDEKEILAVILEEEGEASSVSGFFKIDFLPEGKLRAVLYPANPHTLVEVVGIRPHHTAFIEICRLCGYGEDIPLDTGEFHALVMNKGKEGAYNNISITVERSAVLAVDEEKATLLQVPVCILQLVHSCFNVEQSLLQQVLQDNVRSLAYHVMTLLFRQTHAYMDFSMEEHLDEMLGWLSMETSPNLYASTLTSDSERYFYVRDPTYQLSPVDLKSTVDVLFMLGTHSGFCDLPFTLPTVLTMHSSDEEFNKREGSPKGNGDGALDVRGGKSVSDPPTRNELSTHPKGKEDGEESVADSPLDNEHGTPAKNGGGDTTNNETDTPVNDEATELMMPSHASKRNLRGYRTKLRDTPLKNYGPSRTNKPKPKPKPTLAQKRKAEEARVRAREKRKKTLEENFDQPAIRYIADIPDPNLLTRLADEASVTDEHTVHFSSGDYEDFQTDIEKAREKVRAWMEKADDALDDIVADEDTEVERAEKIAETMDLEACMLMVNGVKEIAWQPNLRGGHRTGDDRLTGRYIVKVRRQSGRIDKVFPSTDWVERHFNTLVLGEVQRVAYDRNRKWGPDGEKGYIDVSKSNIVVKLDDRVINRIKYLPKRTKLVGPIYKRDVDGKYLKEDGKVVKAERNEVEIPAKWKGYSDETNTVVQLDWEWLKANFPRGYLEQVQRSADSNFIVVPPGSKRHHAQVNHTQTRDHTTAYRYKLNPPLHYQQAGDDDRTCLAKSLASGLHYLGLRTRGAKQTASLINNRAHKLQSRSDSWMLLRTFLRKKCPWIRIEELAAQATISAVKPNAAALYVLLGSDELYDHCICVVGGWIFDSNFPRALPLSKVSLDVCCSSEHHPCKFVTTTKGMMLTNIVDQTMYYLTPVESIPMPSVHGYGSKNWQPKPPFQL